MSTSTNGQICFGILFEEDFEFPWGEEVEEWWRKVKGCQPPFELYDSEGEYLNGVVPSEDVIDEYYEHRTEWARENPLPFSLVNCCSRKYPVWILAVPSSVVSVNRGCPEEISLETLRTTPEGIWALLSFCREHLNQDFVEENCKWYLSSYSG